jgi:uncharacterized LabA/DUF88 family protein
MSDRLRIAVFIDFDNIEIGVKNTLNAQFDAGVVLEALKERGEVVSKMAYSDWQRAGGYSRALTQHAIRMVQRNLTPGGDKNGADINLALDALEMAFTHSHINAFVIVGGDSDFISLVEKLKQYDKKVFVVGGRQFTSVIMQRNCHEFIAYENLIGAGGGGRRVAGPTRVERVPLDQVVPLVRRALQVLSEREVSPQLGLLKSTLLQLDSTFSEKSYGAGSFSEFAQKLEKMGVLRVVQGKGGWLVAPADAGSTGEPLAAPEAPAGGDEGEPREAVAAGEPAAAGGPRALAGSPADGVREFVRLLATAQVRRWPLYLRNVKQAIRQPNARFDERAYGFANLTDLLRAAQKAGLLKLERDRQGVIRVFQPALPEGDAAGREAVDAAIAASDLGVPLVVPAADEIAADAQAAAMPPLAESDEVDEDRLPDVEDAAEELADAGEAEELSGTARVARTPPDFVGPDEDPDEPNFNRADLQNALPAAGSRRGGAGPRRPRKPRTGGAGGAGTHAAPGPRAPRRRRPR